MELEGALRGALERNELVLYFQPCVAGDSDLHWGRGAGSLAASRSVGW